MIDSYNPNTVLPEAESVYYNTRMIKALKDCVKVNVFGIETMRGYL